MSNPFARPTVELSVAGLSVMIAMPMRDDIPWQTNLALLQTQTLFHERGLAYDFQYVPGSSLVHKARMELAHVFLKSDKNRLFWIDSDMGWTPDNFMRILALSSKLDVVGATYSARMEPAKFFVRMNDPVEFDAEKTPYGLFSVLGMGLGFTCVSRRVMEVLAARAPKFIDNDGQEKAEVFWTGVRDGKFYGEDMAFFKDIKEVGFDVWMDPQIKLKHVGPKEYTGNFFDGLKRKG